MTRDEVLKMSDEELRIKAAELIGWTEIRPSMGTLYGFVPEYANVTEHERICSGTVPWHREVPDYPNDIAAAWELLTEITARNPRWGVEIYNNDTSCAEEDGLCCEVGGGMIADACEATASRAIARAFILAMEPE